jgi:V/A-type H+/Na+-transporting ATPase subunit I
MLRPRPARWFEILAARDDATLVLEALARTGAVELEARGHQGLPELLRDALPLLGQYAELAARHGAYWPAPETCRPSAFPEPPVATLQRCLVALRAWSHDSEPVIQALQRCDVEKRELLLWQGVLGALGQGTLDPAHLAGAGPRLSVRLFVLPPGVAAEKVFASDGGELETLASHMQIDGAAHLLVAGTPQALQALTQSVSALEGRAYEPPAWLHPDAARNQAHVNERLAALDRDIQTQSAALGELHQRHDLSCTLGDAHRLEWLMHNVRALETGELLCWITGWSSDLSGETLAQALQRSGARALLHFAAPPAHSKAPMLLSNPRWVRPFEIFSRALGMPSSSEADPSALLAIVVPLMFGYMFGDVGQGLLLAAVGWFLRKRYPITRLLMVGGLAAAGFGLMFGSVFGLHKLLPALWLHPLDQPLPVLLAPLVGGGLLLTLGLSLNALEALWRGQWRAWLLTDAALIVVYLGLLGAFIDPLTLWLAAAGALHFCVGHGVQAKRVAAGLRAIGELIEKTLQILINTLSFARVGAFALAHAGLSSAIVALMDATDSSLARALVLIVGNLVVMVLEVMVVSIQTTRLVLFEFFTRFMQAQGRAFRPLSAPPFTHPEAR